MFTGLVRHRATLLDRNVDGRAGSLALHISRPDGWDDLRVGDSIAVNGCCLTITTFDDDSMGFEAGSETLARTLFEQVTIGQKIHVEQALRVGDRMDGHMVTGHVDGLGQLVERIEVLGGRRLRFSTTPELARMLPEKGSVCVDGISLTIAADEPSGFTVELIPETLEATELTRLVAGDSVHVEVDPMARYAAHWLARTGVLNAAGSQT